MSANTRGERQMVRKHTAPALFAASDDLDYGACPGCWPAHADSACSCCGRPTAFVVAAGKHSMTFCLRCWRTLQAVKLQGAVESQHWHAARARRKAS
jgi:hypothetical protein